MDEAIYTPEKLRSTLDAIVHNDVRLSLMLWGPPGIGKSSIVTQVAQAHNLDLIDLRLSQLAPTDLRGLPVAEHEQGIARWYPPEFLPRDGQGILFLDEINMAPPSLQGIAQQLILDRRVGSYHVPDGWFIWAAGNRKEDYASVFDMPAPLGNRFIHYHIAPDLDSFKGYGLSNGIHEHILAFIAYRPELLHKVDQLQPAWPSPRTWEMASALHRTKLEIVPAVGVAAATEFQAYTTLIDDMPDLSSILAGKGSGVFPDEPSVRYAVTIGLAARAKNVEQAMNAFLWMMEKAPAEWVQLLAVDMLRLSRERGQLGELAKRLLADPKAKAFMAQFRELIGLA